MTGWSLSSLTRRWDSAYVRTTGRTPVTRLDQQTVGVGMDPCRAATPPARRPVGVDMDPWTQVRLSPAARVRRHRRHHRMAVVAYAVVAHAATPHSHPSLTATKSCHRTEERLRH